MESDLDLNDVSDDLNSFWWNHIRSEDFGFKEKISDFHNLKVVDDDILIHKEIKEGERFPTIRYHIILDGEAIEIGGKEVRKKLSEKLKEFIEKYKKLPYSCNFNKIQKNSMLIFKYSPTKFDNFQLKIKCEDLKLNFDEADEYFKNIDFVDENSFKNEIESLCKIKLMPVNPIIETVASESGANKVYIFNGKVTEIEKRSSSYMGHINEFYLLDIQGGKTAPDSKKNTMKRNFERVIVKCSEKALSAGDIKVNDIVSLNGKTKEDYDLKFIIQNVRKIAKIED